MKKYLITGLIILIPLILTIFIFIFIIDLFTAPFLNLVTNFLISFKLTSPLMNFPGLVTLIARILIILLIFLVIFLLGFLARWLFFNSLINLTNKLLSKIPFVKTIYKVTRDIMTSLFATKKRKAFRRSIMVTFPSKKSYCIAFETGDVPLECQEKVKMELTSVFIPTAPYPISGYLLMVPQKNLKEIDMTNEDAIKFTVSCGMIFPEVRAVKGKG